MLQVYHQQRLWEQRNIHNSMFQAPHPGQPSWALIALSTLIRCLPAPGTAPASCISLVTTPQRDTVPEREKHTHRPRLWSWRGHWDHGVQSSAFYLAVTKAFRDWHSLSLFFFFFSKYSTEGDLDISLGNSFRFLSPWLSRNSVSCLTQTFSTLILFNGEKP